MPFGLSGIPAYFQRLMNMIWTRADLNSLHQDTRVDLKLLHQALGNEIKKYQSKMMTRPRVINKKSISKTILI